MENYLREQSEEESLWVSQTTPSALQYMSRQHTILGLNFRPHITLLIIQLFGKKNAKTKIRDST